jgi:hypothetical protein
VETNLGKQLRSAVYNNDYKAVDSFIEQGADINYNEPDMVWPSGATPLHVAAVRNIDMTKYLVERGANVVVVDNRGMRPYHYAICWNPPNKEIAEYLKSVEPFELHDLDSKLSKLQCYALTDDLISFLQSNKLRIEIPNNDLYLKEIEFLPLTDTIETDFQGNKLLLLSKEIDGASCELVWDSTKKLMGYVDIEHGEYYSVCSFAEFIENPSDIVYKIANGEYFY